MTGLTDKAVKALLDGATPGPWRADGEPWNRVVWSSSDNRVCFMAHSNGLNDERDIATSNLAAAAPDLARALLEARAENARLRADAQAAVALAWANGVAQARLAVSGHTDWNPSTVRDDILLNIDNGCSPPVDGLAMVEALRKERDEYKRLAIAGNLIALEMRIVEGDRDRLAADLAAAQAQNEALRTVAAAYEAWEADVIMAADWTHATPRMTQNQWDELVRIQGLRNAALTKPEGE